MNMESLECISYVILQSAEVLGGAGTHDTVKDQRCIKRAYLFKKFMFSFANLNDNIHQVNVIRV